MSESGEEGMGEKKERGILGRLDEASDDGPVCARLRVLDNGRKRMACYEGFED